jgi:hypothetical protein
LFSTFSLSRGSRSTLMCFLPSRVTLVDFPVIVAGKTYIIKKIVTIIILITISSKIASCTETRVLLLGLFWVLSLFPIL